MLIPGLVNTLYHMPQICRSMKVRPMFVCTSCIRFLLFPMDPYPQQSSYCVQLWCTVVSMTVAFPTQPVKAGSFCFSVLELPEKKNHSQKVPRNSLGMSTVNITKKARQSIRGKQMLVDDWSLKEQF